MTSPPPQTEAERRALIELEAIAALVHGPKRPTLKQIGDLFGLSRERIRQLQNEALAKMQRAAKKHGFELTQTAQSNVEDGPFPGLRRRGTR